MQTQPDMQFSIFTFLMLLALVGVTFVVTEFLSRRYTVWRRHFVLRDFAAGRGLKLKLPGALNDVLPPRLASLAPPPRARWHFSDATLSVLRMQTGRETYNLLMMRITGNWPATALRPSAQLHSLLDRLDLYSYPSAYGTQRFTLHGLDPAAARKLSDSAIRGLLPAHLGIFLENDMMVIDFSSRPFDHIELDRVVALGKQLAGAVPVLPV